MDRRQHQGQQASGGAERRGDESAQRHQRRYAAGEPQRPGRQDRADGRHGAGDPGHDQGGAEQLDRAGPAEQRASRGERGEAGGGQRGGPDGPVLARRPGWASRAVAESAAGCLAAVGAHRRAQQEPGERQEGDAHARRPPATTATSVSSPATGGPSKEGSTQAAAKAANTLARSSSGMARASSTVSETSISASAIPDPNRPSVKSGHARREGHQPPARR